MGGLAALLVRALGDPQSRRTLLRVAAAAAVAAAGLAVAVFLVLSTALSSFFAASPAPASAAEYCLAPAGTQQASGQWSAEQVTNAATIVRTGQADHIPAYGEVIAVATAMQESSLVNLNHGDQDSLGLFQQRPSQGWGSAAQIMDPVYAANAFYQRLKQVPGWQSLPLSEAAQAVQASGVPGAYAKWQQAAATLVSHVTGTTLTAATQGGGACTAGTVAQRSPLALRAVLAYAYAALGSPYVFGGSCTHPHSPALMLNCDCSSLVQQSFLRAGLHLPRTAEAQWEWGEAGHAQVIPLDQAQPGDVVYLPSYLGANTMGHTGIVVNPKKMIMLDAYETGQPVEFNSYAPSADKYGTHLLTVLRFIATSPGSTS